MGRARRGGRKGWESREGGKAMARAVVQRTVKLPSLLLCSLLPRSLQFPTPQFFHNFTYTSKRVISAIAELLVICVDVHIHVHTSTMLS